VDQSNPSDFGIMSEENPYQPPRAETPRKINWAAIISRAIGSIMLIYWLSLVFDSGIISLKLLLFSLMFLIGPAVGPPTKRQIMREMQQRAGGDAEEPSEPGPSPEEFFRQLEQDETATKESRV
jgi:hypothetical protein